MTTVLDIADKLQGLNIPNEIINALDATDDALLDDIRKQLYAGQNASADTITPRYRSHQYASLKFQMNPAPGFGTPDLRLSGALYRGLFAKVEGDEILFDSPVTYAPGLLTKYGEEVFEPSDPNLDDYSYNEFYPALIEQIEEKTGLNFT